MDSHRGGQAWQKPSGIGVPASRDAHCIGLCDFCAGLSKKAARDFWITINAGAGYHKGKALKAFRDLLISILTKRHFWGRGKPPCYFLPQKVAKNSKRANQGQRTVHPRAPV